MNWRTIRSTAGVLCVLGLVDCDPIVYARATTPLIAPIDSACLKQALASRLGAPSMRSGFEKGTHSRAATLTLYYNRTSFKQTYPDTGLASLAASQPLAAGLKALRNSAPVSKDSADRQLERELLSVRDACGGQAPPGSPELGVIP